MSETSTGKAGIENGDTNQLTAGSTPDPERRQFVTHAAATAAVAGAGTLGVPMIARAAEPITLKFQTTWLVDDIFYEYARYYGCLVNDMSGGRLRLSVLPAGAVAGTLHMQDAVNSGAIDGGHSVATWYDKNKAYSLIGGACHLPMIIIPEMFNKTDISFEKITRMIISSIIKRKILGISYGVAIISEGVFHFMTDEEIQSTEINFTYDDHGHPELGNVSKAHIFNLLLLRKLKN